MTAANFAASSLRPSPSWIVHIDLAASRMVNGSRSVARPAIASSAAAGSAFIKNATLTWFGCAVRVRVVGHDLLELRPAATVTSIDLPSLGLQRAVESSLQGRRLLRRR